MIDSVVWKEKLEQDLRSLKKRSTQRRWSIRSMDLFERELILLFCAIRCLIEAGKLTDSLIQREYECTAYPNKGEIVDDHTKYLVEENYDLDAGVRNKFSLRFLANQFVHAYVIYPDFWISEEISGVLVCSDWEKYNSLLQISFNVLIRIVEDVVTDEVTKVIFERDKKSGEMRKTIVS